MDDSSGDDEKLLLHLYQSRRGVHRKKYRRVWVHSMNSKRSVYGSYHHIFQELFTDPERFQSYCRMNKASFDELVHRISSFVKDRNDTNCRKFIRLEERLIVTLRYLATGASFRSLSFIFRMGESTIGSIVLEICDALYRALQPEFMPKPTKDTWTLSSKMFYEMWNMPNTVGAIDGKHIRIKKPPKAGSQFYNYKGYHSVVLMAAVDADCMFITIDVGDYGRNSDGGVFKKSGLGRSLLENKLELPKDHPLPGESEPFPFFFVGDEAFPMSNHMLRPYPRRELTNEKRIFNYRLSRARRTVECAFGMLVSKWRVLDTAIGCKNLDKIDSIVCATCVLHNFVRKKEGKLMYQVDDNMLLMGDSQPINCMISSDPIPGSRPTNKSIWMRDKLCQYLLTKGRVDWQDKVVNIEPVVQ